MQSVIPLLSYSGLHTYMIVHVERGDENPKPVPTATGGGATASGGQKDKMSRYQ